jgi:rare lipoprotein A
LVVSLGAAQGPNSSGSVDTQKKKPLEKEVAGPELSPAVTHTKPKPQAFQVGTASWYGADFDGRATASGEPYNMYDLTAAHPTLPLGSWVRVTNLHNGRAVNVRINDRGPIIPGRIIDLSFGAARAWSFRSKGLQRVRLDRVQPEEVAFLTPVAN